MPPAPKPTASRERDHKRRHTSRSTITGSDGRPVGPSLYELTGRAAREWNPRVRAWFEAWRCSPQARLFVSGVEWELLGRAAVLLEQFFDPATSPAVRVQTQQAVRALESQMGATHADRVKLHMRIAAATPEETERSEPDADVVDYRSLVGS